jgi:very-short-patch-repair endonuclease
MSALTERARDLRKNITDAERAFWRRVKDRRFRGLKFRRQVPMGYYIVDFLCHETKIIVELDGGQHVERTEYDEKRTQFLEEQGYQVIRFWDNEVLKNMEGVLLKLSRMCNLK